VSLNKVFNKVILISIPIIIISFSPFISYDPFNISKFFTLSVFGVIIGCLLLMQLNQFNKLKEKWAVFLVIIFVFWGFISLIFSPIRLTDGLFGLPGRHTGVLTYLFLSIYFVAMLLITDNKFYSSLIKTLYSTALIAMLYGFLQTVNLDPVNWSSPPPAAFSFFGNQNFLSAFIGIISVSGLGYLFSKMTKNKHKSLIIIFTLFSLLLMNFTDSTQGYLIFLVGLSVIILIWLKHQEKYSRYLTFIIGFFVSGIILVVFDLLQKTPWPSVLYEPSVSARGDFWRSAWRMSLENPVFGVGLDGFVDHYRLNRDLSAVLARGSEIRTDSAHNIFLELLSGGGFPLLIIYLSIVVLVLIRSISYIKQSNDFDPIHSGLFAAWIAFMVQVSISINQIGLALTGWVLSGALIGYQNQSEQINRFNSSKLKPKNIAVIFLATSVGLGIGTPPLVIDAKFREALFTSNVAQLVDISDDWPINSDRISTIGGVLRVNGYPSEAIKILRKGIEFNPNHFETWRELSLCTGITESEKKLAENNMKALDPFGFGAN
jgi:O-antigen ligase